MRDGTVHPVHAEPVLEHSGTLENESGDQGIDTGRGNHSRMGPELVVPLPRG